MRASILGYKSEYPTAILNVNGKEISDTNEIIKEHENYFKKLLTNREPMEKFQQQTKNIKNLFSKLLKKQSKLYYHTDAPFKMWEMENVVENLKKNKYLRYDNLSNELFIDSGKTFRTLY